MTSVLIPNDPALEEAAEKLIMKITQYGFIALNLDRCDNVA